MFRCSLFHICKLDPSLLPTRCLFLIKEESNLSQTLPRCFEATSWRKPQIFCETSLANSIVWIKPDPCMQACCSYYEIKLSEIRLSSLCVQGPACWNRKDVTGRQIPTVWWERLFGTSDGSRTKTAATWKRKEQKKYLVNWKKVAFSELCYDGGQEIV